MTRSTRKGDTMFNHYNNYEDFRNALFRWFGFEDGDIREDHLKRAWELIKDREIHCFCDPSNEFSGFNKDGDKNWIGFEFFCCDGKDHLEKMTVMGYLYTPSVYGGYNKTTLIGREVWD